jgi:hypothetical protein
VTTRRHVLEAGGLDPAAHGSLQRTFDGVRADIDALAATAIAYTPGDATDWVAPAPTTVQQALDRLAEEARRARVADGLSGPIP